MSVVHLHNGQLVIEQNGRYADQQGRRIRAAGMKHSWSEVFRFGDEDLTKIFNMGFFFYFSGFEVEDVDCKTLYVRKQT